MSKKQVKLFSLLLALLFILTPVHSFGAAEVIGTAQADKGIILVDYEKRNDARAVVRISKGTVNYDYDLVAGGQYPLQSGNGKYTILVGEAAAGGSFKVVARKEVTVELENEQAPFLQSSIQVNWNQETKAVMKARELVKNAKTDQEKVEIIYRYVIQNYVYDYEKAKTVKAGYIPNVDQIFDILKGICYDYATVMAAMLRSVGVPTKVVTGYYAELPGVYHAWNQVYLADSQQWITIDPTNDAIRVQAGQSVKMIQDANDFTVVKVY